MEAIPSQQHSPQTVGNEFVRQYYTLLNKAPYLLHRFYNNFSSYTHGDSQLVVSQRDIHNRIQQLDFNECQAKITTVDAQASPGGGVVVQVSGELSNDGQPMRRFSQTFVLAPQGSKKYYVHNDIFSYLDVGHATKQDRSTEPLDNSEIQMGNQAVQVSGNMFNLSQEENELDQNEEEVMEPGVQLVNQAVQGSCNLDITMEDEQIQNKKQTVDPGVQLVNQTDLDITMEDEQNENKKQTEEPGVQLVNQAVQVSCHLDMEDEQNQNKKHTEDPGVQLVNQVSCHKVSLNLHINMEDEQNQNKEQTEEPEIQIVGQAVKPACYLGSGDHDLYKEDKQNQNKRPDIQMVDEAVQVACDMVSKHTQSDRVVSSAASQTVEFFLPAKYKLAQPHSIQNAEQKPTPAGFEVSPQLIQQQRQEQPPHTVIQNEEKPGTLAQKQLLISESIGGEVAAAQANTNNKRYGKSLISIELDISVYLVDKP